MIIKVFKDGDCYRVQFTQGVQTFELDYESETKVEALWTAEMLRRALVHFAESGEINIKMKQVKRF